MGDPTTAAVSILPTIRINGKQFRGTLDVRGERQDMAWYHMLILP